MKHPRPERRIDMTNYLTKMDNLNNSVQQQQQHSETYRPLVMETPEILESHQKRPITRNRKFVIENNIRLCYLIFLGLVTIIFGLTYEYTFNSDNPPGYFKYLFVAMGIGIILFAIIWRNVLYYRCHE